MVEQVAFILNAMEHWPPIVAFGLFHIDAIEFWSGTTRNFQGEFARGTTGDGLVFSENPLDKLLQRIAAVAGQQSWRLKERLIHSIDVGRRGFTPGSAFIAARNWQKTILGQVSQNSKA